MAEEPAGERQEAPSQKRLEKARQDGQAPLSREAVGFAALLGAGVGAVAGVPPLALQLVAAARGLLAGAHQAEPGAAATAMGLALLLLVLPVAAGAALGATAATLAQTGFLLRPAALLPTLSRIDPRAALGRIFGAEELVQLARTLLKFLLVGAALWQVADPAILQAALHRSVADLLGLIAAAGLRLLAATLAAIGLLAGADILWLRWRQQRRLRMSRQEVKEEARESDGDPLVKARLRRLREQRARRRMIAAVGKATVVITNPTHYAVALAYAQGQAAAPRLVAKGVDDMAARIRAAAKEHGVPIVADPPLARALHRLEPDTEIPAEHWAAVAEIIAYVWRLGARGGTRARG